ncbi:MAG TPA: hypothetical protein VL691_14760 [Vicinamibacteria bacterium]|nr:hypothetical protein [Vicinamibacteria bacterium]
MSLRSNTGRLAVLVSAAVLVPAFSPCQEVEPAVPTIFVAGPAALDVSRAARDAIRKLQEPGCQRLLDDFTAREGRPLRETLGNSTPEAYFVGLVLRNGEIPVGSGHCASPGAAAFTTNGAAVFVCGTSFQRLGRGARANALIHEMLHTLGLRENPPSSAEISRRVALRCGG